MKRRLLWAFLLCSSVVCADDADYTGGMSNGRGWKKFSNETKIFYLSGIYDAAKVMLLLCTEVPVPTGITIGETAQALDGFYSDPLNSSIAITGALRYLKRKAEGADDAELNLMKARMRGN